MKSRQDSKLSMYLATRDFLTKNAAVVNPLPNYSGYYDAFMAAIAKITADSEQQKFDKSGNKTFKLQQKNALVVLTVDTARRLQLYALQINNPLLRSETRYTESTLRNSSDNALQREAHGVWSRAQENLEALAPYGITAATQEALLNAANGYQEVIPKPRIGTSETHQMTLQLTVGFAAADSALENIDGMVEIVRIAQADFYNGYRSVRKTIHTGHTLMAVKGRVTDAADGQPLKNVLLSFAPTGNGRKLQMAQLTRPLVKKTAKKGGFNVKILPAGSYSVNIQRSGYAEQTATLAVTEGIMSVLNVQLALL